MYTDGTGSIRRRTAQVEPSSPRELPTLLDARLNTNGVKSLLGISMGSQGAMMLATAIPECTAASRSSAFATRRSTTWAGSASSRRCRRAAATSPTCGARSVARWGRPRQRPERRGTAWHGHLRGGASGVPGKYEDPAASDWFDRVFIGGPMEVLANGCTRLLDARLDELNIRRRSSTRRSASTAGRTGATAAAGMADAGALPRTSV